MLGTEIRTQLVKAFCSSLCALFHFFSTCGIFSARNNNKISNCFNDPQEKNPIFFKCRIELGCSHPFWEGLDVLSSDLVSGTLFFFSLSLGQVTLPCYSLVADPRKIKKHQSPHPPAPPFQWKWIEAQLIRTVFLFSTICQCQTWTLSKTHEKKNVKTQRAYSEMGEVKDGGATSVEHIQHHVILQPLISQYLKLTLWDVLAS